MAHKLIEEDLIETRKTKKKFTMPDMEGKFGFAVYMGGKEYFFGLTVGNVTIEKIVRTRMIKTPKAGVKVLRID